MSTTDEAAAPDEIAALKRSCRILANITARNHQVMEAARIEMGQNGPHAAMQWILGALPDVWDDDETAWDGKESAEAWFDRTESFYRAAQDDAAGSGTDDTGRAPLASPEQSRERSDGSDEERAEPHMNLLDTAWGVIANAGWDGMAQTPGWQEAAVRWRDDYHRWLDLHLRPGGYHTWEQLADSLIRERDALFSEVAGLRLERARAGSAALAAADLDLETPAASWRERAEAAEGKLAGLRDLVASWRDRAERDGSDLLLHIRAYADALDDCAGQLEAIISTEGDEGRG